LIVAGIYVFIACFWSEAVEDFAGVLFVALLLGLPCIWFGDELGKAMGPIGHGRIDTSTPGCLIRFVGWLLLVILPFIGFIIWDYMGM